MLVGIASLRMEDNEAPDLTKTVPDSTRMWPLMRYPFNTAINMSRCSDRALYTTCLFNAVPVRIDVYKESY